MVSLSQHRHKIQNPLRPGHTALYGLITAKTHQKVVSRVKQTMLSALMSSLRRATVDLLTWQDAGKNRNGVGRSKKFWTAQNFSLRTTTAGTRCKDVQHTWDTRETHLIIRVPAVIKTWGDAVRRESLEACPGQSTVIGQVLRDGIAENSVCLAAYHWQMDFPVLRQCLGGA